MSSEKVKAIKSLRDRVGAGISQCKKALEETDYDLEKAVLWLRKQGLALRVSDIDRESKEGIIVFAEKEHAVAVLVLNTETDFVVRNDRFISLAGKIVSALALHPETDSKEELLTLKTEEGTSVEESIALAYQVLKEVIVISDFKVFKKQPNSSWGVYSHMGGKRLAIVELLGTAGKEELARGLAVHAVARSPRFLSKTDIPQETLDQEREVILAQCEGKPQPIVDRIVEGKIQAFAKEHCFLSQDFFKNPDVTVENLLKDQAPGVCVGRWLSWVANGSSS